MKKFTVEELRDMVLEVNSWDGSLEEYEVYDMESFDDIVYGWEPLEIANRIHFGDFSPMDDYFTFNGCGNLESKSELDFKDLIKDGEEEIIEKYSELVESGDITDWGGYLEEAE